MIRKVARPAVLPRQAPGNPGRALRTRTRPGSRIMTATRNRAAMTPAINGNLISSDRTAHTVGPSTGHQHAREVSWLPGWLPGRDGAIIAMMLRGTAGPPGVHSARRVRPAAGLHKNGGGQPNPPPVCEAAGPRAGPAHITLTRPHQIRAERRGGQVLAQPLLKLSSPNRAPANAWPFPSMRPPG